MKLSFTPHTLYFKRPFKIAHGTRTSTPIVITTIEYEGRIGYGEASMPPYLGETHESVCHFLAKAADFLKNKDDQTHPLFVLIRLIDELAPGNTAAKASVDIALHDLYGKLFNRPTWDLLGADKNKAPYSTYTLGMDEPEIIRQKIIEGMNFPFLKVKLNGEEDKAVIRAIRKYSDKPIAIDVNQGWKKKEVALEMILWLQDQNVLFVEQPLDKNDLDGAHWLLERSPLPIYADESVQRLNDIAKIKDCFHGINIKLMKSTGISEANSMIQLAREHHLKVLIGCMSETSCAISAAAQLSPFADYADLDGSFLMQNDLFNGITFTEGKITLSDKPGIGATPKG